MSGKPQAGDHPHLGLAVFATAAMALALAGGLQFLGLTGRFDAVVERMFTPGGMEAPPLSLAPVVLWLSAALVSFALPAVILNIPGSWRRIMVWGGTIALTVAWGPVMILAAHKPQIGVVLIAVLWSGFCAMFYTTNHALPVDRPSSTTKRPTHGPR